MRKRRLGRTDLEIAPLVFGGNVFGWTVDEPTAFQLLDRFTAAGLNAIDTADSYSRWVPGNRGGESETIIGNWLAASPQRREAIVLVTKVGSELAPGDKGLSTARIVTACENSLRRLRTDRIDVYLSHFPDPQTPIQETLRAYEMLIRDGKVRTVGASNYDAAQLRNALSVASRSGLPRYEVLQPEYNLYDRWSFEGPLRDLCFAENIGVITYYSLASGFLSGKYRSPDDLGKSVRGERVRGYLDARGLRILAALDTIATAHGATPAEVALAWVMSRDGVTAPIASATTLAQVDSLVRAVSLVLSPPEVDSLNAASQREQTP